MAFDKEAESHEFEFHIELIFKSGRPTQAADLPMPPSAYIALGSYSSDQRGRPMITLQEMSFDALKAQVEDIKAALDARVAEAKARFTATAGSKAPQSSGDTTKTRVVSQFEAKSSYSPMGEIGVLRLPESAP